jgi:acyl-CoA synthetase (AMP-forming)/AMP-acid ligase II
MQDWFNSLDHTMPELIAEGASRYGDEIAIIGEDGAQLSFRALEQAARTGAAALIRAGVAHGERVAIWAPNSKEWIVAACAAEMIGAVMVPINTRFRGAEAAYILERSGACLLCTVSSFLGADYVAMLRSAKGGPEGELPVAGLPALRGILLLDQAEPAECVESWAAFVAGRSAPVEAVEARIAEVTPDTLCDLLFTSGTTGSPKGAMHAHGQALWMAGIWNRSNDLRRGDRALIVNPFFHSFGYRSGWVSALLAGMTAYPVALFDAEAVLRRIETERITVLMGAPTLFTSLLDHPRRGDYDLSSLRVGHTGAANMSVELIARAREELGFDLFLTSFGLTESTALVSVNYPDADFETIAHTVGYPLPRTEIRIAGAEGGEAPAGGSGELLVRGPNVMKGYFEDPEATAAAIDSEGWLHTGDVGAIDEAGRLRILDRLKDVVIVGGFNAYPAEIENALRQHQAVADVAIIAIPDARLGEVCGACVVLKPGYSLSLHELAEWSRERLANFKVPRQLFLLDEFPRTPLGKVQKFVLRKQVLPGLAAPPDEARPSRDAAGD